MNGLRNQKSTVLIVDDEPINLITLTLILENDYKVLATKHGKKVVDILSKEKPDIVLLDICMPEIDGYTLIKEIKNNNEICDIPILFVTASDEDEDVEMGLELGAVDFIIKPVNKMIVKQRINNHLELQYYRDHLKDKKGEYIYSYPG